ncbi:MAG: hypothetical protein HY904_18845 [Deltaproteobacteria bacterium]|nr:hypothetical protein [Deltaproteobacteria bacterium]
MELLLGLALPAEDEAPEGEVPLATEEDAALDEDAPAPPEEEDAEDDEDDEDDDAMDDDASDDDVREDDAPVPDEALLLPEDELLLEEEPPPEEELLPEEEPPPPAEELPAPEAPEDDDPTFSSPAGPEHPAMETQEATAVSRSTFRKRSMREPRTGAGVRRARRRQPKPLGRSPCSGPTPRSQQPSRRRETLRRALREMAGKPLAWWFPPVQSCHTA